jgi:hypothetical protein
MIHHQLLLFGENPFNAQSFSATHVRFLCRVAEKLALNGCRAFTEIAYHTMQAVGHKKIEAVRPTSVRFRDPVGKRRIIPFSTDEQGWVIAANWFIAVGRYSLCRSDAAVFYCPRDALFGFIRLEFRHACMAHFRADGCLILSKQRCFRFPQDRRAHS